MRDAAMPPQSQRTNRRPRWREDELATLKETHPLEAVATRYRLALATSGTRLVALCPFHEETRPSFTIFPETQRWWCFGCRRGGDVIELVRLLEGVGFREAVERLGRSPSEIHPFPLATSQPLARQNVSTDSIYAERVSPEGRLALQVAAACYARELRGSAHGRHYLHARGIPDALARMASLGYCSGTQLRDALRRHGVPLRAGWAVGLLVGRDGRERFTGRITIPEVRDGHACWLTSRLLEDDTDAPRYLSLPGPRPLYGAARVRDQPAVIGVEGYFDALTLWWWGLPAFAAGGVSLPTGELELLRDTRVIYLAFDQDAPGQEAAHVLARQFGSRLRLVQLPPGVKDVNELAVHPDGERQFRACLQQAAQVDGVEQEAA